MEPLSSLLTVWHMGPLHAYERWLTLILAFGPFLLLALVFVIRRRMDDAEDQSEDQDENPGENSAEHPGESREPHGDGTAHPTAARTSAEERRDDALASGQAGSVRQPGESDAMLDLERRAE